MRKMFLWLMLVLACGCSLNRQFVAAVDETWQVIGPRYCEYVKSDASLTDDDKGTRLRTAQMLSEVIVEARQ